MIWAVGRFYGFVLLQVYNICLLWKIARGLSLRADPGLIVQSKAKMMTF